MPRSTRPKMDREERRENALRPCKYLGYNWDELGVYFIERGAYQIAEAQLRRAVWLNPYEPDFKVHLAGCLFREAQYGEARQVILQVLGNDPARTDAKHLIEMTESRIAQENTAAASPVEGAGSRADDPRS